MTHAEELQNKMKEAIEYAKSNNGLSRAEYGDYAIAFLIGEISDLQEEVNKLK